MNGKIIEIINSKGSSNKHHRNIKHAFVDPKQLISICMLGNIHKNLNSSFKNYISG